MRFLLRITYCIPEDCERRTYTRHVGFKSTIENLSNLIQRIVKFHIGAYGDHIEEMKLFKLKNKRAISQKAAAD